MGLIKLVILMIAFIVLVSFLLSFNRPIEDLPDKEELNSTINISYRNISPFQYNQYECKGFGRTVVFSYENGTFNQVDECSKYLIDPGLDIEDIEKAIINKTQINYIIIVNDKNRILWEGEMSERLSVDIGVNTCKDYKVALKTANNVS